MKTMFPEWFDIKKHQFNCLRLNDPIPRRGGKTTSIAALCVEMAFNCEGNVDIAIICDHPDDYRWYFGNAIWSLFMGSGDVMKCVKKGKDFISITTDACSVVIWFFSLSGAERRLDSPYDVIFNDQQYGKFN